MIPGSTLILLATIGQPPGGASPAHPPSVVSKPGDAVKHWLDGTSPIDGRPCKVLGWMEFGVIRYLPADNPHLFAPTPAPAPPPAPAPSPAPAPTPAPPVANRIPTGVIASRMPHPEAGHKAWYGGNAPARPGATGAPDRAPAPDLHLTVIGPDRDRATVLRGLRSDPDLAGVVAGLGDRLAVQDYEPTNPLVADVHLPDGGTPDIVIQDATGKELNRYHADPGPKVLAQALRRADPSYRPGKGGDEAGPVPGWAYLVAGGLGVYLINQALKRTAVR